MVKRLGWSKIDNDRLGLLAPDPDRSHSHLLLTKIISCKIDFACNGSVYHGGYLRGLLSIFDEVSYAGRISVPENGCRMHWEGSSISGVPIHFKAIG